MYVLFTCSLQTVACNACGGLFVTGGVNKLTSDSTKKGQSLVENSKTIAIKIETLLTPKTAGDTAIATLSSSKERNSTPSNKKWSSSTPSYGRWKSSTHNSQHRQSFTPSNQRRRSSTLKAQLARSSSRQQQGQGISPKLTAFLTSVQ